MTDWDSIQIEALQLLNKTIELEIDGKDFVLDDSDDDDEGEDEGLKMAKQMAKKKPPRIPAAPAPKPKPNPPPKPKPKPPPNPAPVPHPQPARDPQSAISHDQRLIDFLTHTPVNQIYKYERYDIEDNIKAAKGGDQRQSVRYGSNSPWKINVKDDYFNTNPREKGNPVHEWLRNTRDFEDFKNIDSICRLLFKKSFKSLKDIIHHKDNKSKNLCRNHCQYLEYLGHMIKTSTTSVCRSNTVQVGYFKNYYLGQLIGYFLTHYGMIQSIKVNKSIQCSEDYPWTHMDHSDDEPQYNPLVLYLWEDIFEVLREIEEYKQENGKEVVVLENHRELDCDELRNLLMKDEVELFIHTLNPDYDPLEIIEKKTLRDKIEFRLSQLPSGLRENYAERDDDDLSHVASKKEIKSKDLHRLYEILKTYRSVSE